MTKIAAVALAIALTAGTMSTASAFGTYAANPYLAEESEHVGPDGTVHDHCHGMASGTAHALCGTATGGPSGGLF